MPDDLAKHLCWHCNEEAGMGHFCGHCVKLQPLCYKEDYFRFMGFERRLQLDPKKLEETFYTLSRKFHPDFYQDKSEKEKAFSLERSAVLNNAYQVLKDPVQRTEYLLNLEFPLPEKERTKAPTTLLQEIFEIQEVLESYREAKNAGDPKRLGSLKVEADKVSRDVLEKIRQREKALEVASAEWDRLVSNRFSSPEALKEAKLEQAQKLRSILDELTYLRTLLQSIQTGGPVIH